MISSELLAIPLVVPGDSTGTAVVRVEIADRLEEAEPPAWLPLTDDDRARLAAFRREEDARRFLTGRVIVHRRLQDEWGVPPGAAVFARRFTAAGEWKPTLSAAPEWGFEGVVWPEVSISHSGSFVAVAFCQRAEVGIDIEQHAAFVDADDLLALALTREERARVSSVADAACAFTAKEAVLKAVGFGLAIDPLLIEILDGAVRRFDHPECRPVALASIGLPGPVSAAVAVASGAPGTQGI